MKTHLALTALAVILTARHSHAAEKEPDFESEVRVFQVLTNISGNSSQTLPCTTGDIVHLIDEKLDGTSLTMKGPDLKWDGAGGKKPPNNPLIAYVGWYHLVLPRTDPVATIESRQDTDYFAFEEGKWELRKARTKPGIRIEFSLKPQPGTEGIVENDYNFEFTYIKEREKLPQAPGLDAGMPLVESIGSRGKWQFRLGEWSCLRLSVPSKGRLYVFVRTAPVDPGKPALP